MAAMLPKPDYERGSVRLWCADCLDILPLLEPGSVDAVVTDPPYLIGAQSIGNARSKSGTWADLNNAAHWFSAWYRMVDRLVGTTGHFATFCNWRSQPLIICAMAAAGMSATSCLIWDKEWIGPSYKNALRPTYEVIVIASGTDAVIEDRGLSDIWRQKWMACQSSETDHPAEKPLALMNRLIAALTVSGTCVIDPFLGSGTADLAAVELRREFIGIEIDLKHFEASCNRIDEAFDKLALIDPTEPAIRSQRDLFTA